MTRTVPHKRTDPVSYFNTRTGQGVGQLMGSVTSFLVGLTANAIFCQRHDFFVGRDFSASIQDIGHQ